MNKCLTIPALLTVSLLAFGCEKKTDTVTISVPAATPIVVPEAPTSATSTFETKKLGAAIDSYIARPTAENAADARKAFADLDGEIAELQSRVATTTGNDRSEAQAKLTNMQTYRAAETVRYNASNLTAPISGVTPADDRSGAEKVGDTLRKAGDEIKDTAENLGDKIKDTSENVGDRVKDATGN